MITHGVWFEQFSNFCDNHCSFIIPKSGKTRKQLLSFWDESYKEAIAFTGLNVTKEGVLSLAYMIFLFTLLLFIITDLFIILIYKYSAVVLDSFTLLTMILISIIIPFILMQFIISYPKTLVRYKKIHSLGDIPEVLSYLVMSLKISPNLEQSLIFTAKESTNSLSNDLRKLLWDVQIRIYHNIDDAITSFANKWGNYNDAFKRSIHLLRSSIDEPNEAQRLLTLDKALDIGMDGTRDMMRSFAEQLHQPTMIIYSIGIMIPLSIIAMLPAAALIGLQITIFQVFFFYDIFLPFILFIYIRKILLNRPVTFSPPKIGKNIIEISPNIKNKIVLLSLGLWFLISTPALLYLITRIVPQSFLIQLVIPLESFNALIPVSIFLLWGVVISFSFYSYLIFTPFNKLRNNTKKMEREFGDALYIIGKRMGEGKSPEESIAYASVTMKGSKISKLFNDTLFALSSHHSTIFSAFFHQEYGSMRKIYSNRIQATIKLFVKGIQKSQKTASLSIIRLADHLKSLQDVEKHIKESLSTLTSTLQSTASIFAPLIAGVTLAITQLISSIVEKMMISSSDTLFSMQDTMLSDVTMTFALENIEPIWFVLVVGIYVIELAILLTRFTNGIDNGDDTISFFYQLSKNLPIAMMVLTLSIFASSIFLNTLSINV